MKKYITLAALLAAGTTFANAETLTTTFDNANQSSATDVELSVEGLEGVTADVVSLVNNTGTDVVIKTAGAAGTDAKIFSPDTNVGNGSPWTAEFKYTLGGTVEVTSLQSIELGVVLFASGGGYQSSGAQWTGSIGFTATILDENDLALGSFEGSLPLGNGKDEEPFTVSLSNVSESAVDLSSTDSFTMKLALTDNLSAGCYVGLKTIKQEVSVVPEPSAFGMLAGLGALAVVASRRRRK